MKGLCKFGPVSVRLSDTKGGPVPWSLLLLIGGTVKAGAIQTAPGPRKQGPRGDRGGGARARGRPPDWYMDSARKFYFAKGHPFPQPKERHPCSLGVALLIGAGDMPERRQFKILKNARQEERSRTLLICSGGGVVRVHPRVPLTNQTRGKKCRS